MSLEHPEEDPRRAEAARVVAELSALRLAPEDWDAVEDVLADVATGDLDRTDELARVVFEARVRSRFSGPKAAADVVPTKQTSVLPVVGLVCGGLLVGVGALLGGGVILAGIVALGVFVFGIAFAGSRVAHRGGDAAAGGSSRTPPVPMPPEIGAWVAAFERGR